jgi:hypothetical protein
MPVKRDLASHFVEEYARDLEGLLSGGCLRRAKVILEVRHSLDESFEASLVRTFAPCLLSIIADLFMKQIGAFKTLSSLLYDTRLRSLDVEIIFRMAPGPLIY